MTADTEMLNWLEQRKVDIRYTDASIGSYYILGWSHKGHTYTIAARIKKCPLREAILDGMHREECNEHYYLEA